MPASTTLFGGARRVLRTLVAVPGAVTLLVLSLLLGLAFSFVMPFLSLFGIQEVGLSPLGFGVFMTVSSISSVLLSTWLARASDTILSRRSVLLLGGVTGAIGYTGYALTRDVWLLTLCSVVFLGLSAVTFGQLFALSRDTLERGGVAPTQIPLYLNIVRLFFALAWTVGPALGAALVARSFTASFLTAAAMFALFSVLVLLLVPHTPPSEQGMKAAQELPLRVAFKDPALLANFTAFALFFGCSTLGMMNLPQLLLQELGSGKREVGIAYSVAPVFEVPFMVYVGVLATRVRHGRLVLGAMLIASAYYGGLACSRRPFDVYVLQVASAAIVAVMSGVAISFFQTFLPNQAGSATNLYSSASRVGSTIGYLGFGAIAGKFGHRAAFVVSSASTLVCAAIVHVFRHHGSDTVGEPHTWRQPRGG